MGRRGEGKWKGDGVAPQGRGAHLPGDGGDVGLLGLPIFQPQVDDRSEVAKVMGHQDQIVRTRCRSDQEIHGWEILAMTDQIVTRAMREPAKRRRGSASLAKMQKAD